MKKQLLLFFAGSIVVAACLIKTAGPRASLRPGSAGKASIKKLTIKTSEDIKKIEYNAWHYRQSHQLKKFLDAMLKYQNTIVRRQEIEGQLTELRKAGIPEQELYELNRKLVEITEQALADNKAIVPALELSIHSDTERKALDKILMLGEMWNMQSNIIKILKEELAACQGKKEHTHAAQGDYKSAAAQEHTESIKESEEEPGNVPMAPGGPR